MISNCIIIISFTATLIVVNGAMIRISQYFILFNDIPTIHH